MLHRTLGWTRAGMAWEADRRHVGIIVGMLGLEEAKGTTTPGTATENMNEDDLLVSLESTLSSAQASEARGDADAAVAKTAAIKNIQKALTARILKRLDDGQPLVEVARKMKAMAT